MTPKKHSRKVTVNRRTDSHTAVQPAGHKVVAVRLKNNGSAVSSPSTGVSRKQITNLPELNKTAANVSPVTAEPDAPVIAAIQKPQASSGIAAPDTSVKAAVDTQPQPQKKDVPESKPETETSAPSPLPATAKPPVPDKPACKGTAVPTASAACHKNAAVTPVEPVTADRDVPSDAAPSPDPIVAAENAPSDRWYIPQKWKDISLLRKLIMIASVALALFSLLPLAVGVLSPGIVPPVMIAAFFFCCALYWPVINGCESTWGNVIIAVVAVCVLAGVTYLSFVSGKMISASANVLPEDRGDVTVVVLGCKINGDQPSRMLHARLEKASEFLLEHPQAHCIVTGGKGADEDYPESYVMKKYLVDKGISPMRIIMEDKSTSTLENINFAAELADIYNCHDRFLIVTDRFHQYRAVTAANDLGIVTYALNVETVWYLAMPYWFREMVAITRDWFLA